MTTEEFSNEFDTLVSSYRRFKGFDNKEELDSIEFNEFEKSQFLTSAQEQVVTELYNGQLLDGFESTEQVRKYLDRLIKYKDITLINGQAASFVPRSGLKYYKVNLNEVTDTSKLMVITYEAVSFNDSSLSCKGIGTVQVTPVRHDELVNIVRNPFRGPSASRVIRVDVGPRELELISKYNLDKYYIGFLEKPAPIILAPLNDLTINDVSTVQTCSLDEMLHRVILRKAVQLAMQSKVSTSQTKE